MDTTTFSTLNLREQGGKYYVVIVIERTKNWSSRECFLANYVNEGDLQKISSVNDSQYTIFKIIIVQICNTNNFLFVTLKFHVSDLAQVVSFSI